MKAIPVPVRERILHLYDQGKSTCEIATSLDYCVAAVRGGAPALPSPRDAGSPNSPVWPQDAADAPPPGALAKAGRRATRRDAGRTGGTLQAAHLHHGSVAQAAGLEL